LTRGLRLALCLLLLGLAACAHLTPAQRQRAGDIAEQAQSREVRCEAPCAVASPLRELAAQARAESTPASPRHRIVLLDRGQDSLLARVHLIRSATRSIELQTFIFERDDAGGLVLDELLAAARRGVRVRVLLDQLYGLSEARLQAALASYHRNFELRVYNPTFEEAQTQQLEFAASIILRFKRFNQRMHSKLLLVDGEMATVGGRNYQDRYFDWSPVYNYRDRDLLVAGPVTAQMQENFEQFWRDRRSLPAAHLADVGKRLLRPDGPPKHALEPRPHSARVLALQALAGDGEQVLARLRPNLFAVGAVDFLADLPSKHDDAQQRRADASQGLRALIADTQSELVLQTPYLVLSRPARQLFRQLHRRGAAAPAVEISTNSLAATDAFPVYAMSHKYKRLYLRELGFRIHEFKPFPASAPIDLAATGALKPGEGLPIFGSGSSGSASGPVPLKRAGVRVGLHAKSMVIDGRIGVVGSHNFDPRSDDFNTESAVVVHDPAFAAALAASIRHDMTGENAWAIAPRAQLPILGRVHYYLGKLSEKLPIFDIWPFPYATSYQLKPGCQPQAPDDPGFMACHEAVGDFPEVDLPLKSIYTRVLTAFGAGLVPIL
jgi:phosphatidylserine/phosphatidylglycerophosphate/cardiolipin synthase-like enzyme